MKYRVAKKIIKRTPRIHLWLTSRYQLVQAAVNHMLNGDSDSVGICLKLMDFDCKQCLINANKIGITARYLKLYYHKTYATKYFCHQRYKHT